MASARFAAERAQLCGLYCGGPALLAALRDTTMSDQAADFYKRNILGRLTAPVLNHAAISRPIAAIGDDAGA